MGVNLMIRSLEELENLRKKTQAEMRIREGIQGARVIVSMGTCGIAAGAREVMAVILEELGKRKLDEVMVTQTGCMGLCEYEPLVEVVKPGQPQVIYHHLDAEKARQIVVKHLVNNQPVGEWAITR
jgi:(2Fe-2S) ferredoxin